MSKKNQKIQGNQNIQGDNLYINLTESEKQDYGVIDEIIKHVVNIASDQTISHRDSADKLLVTREKIKLNFPDGNDRREVEQYFTLAYKKLHYIEKSVSALDSEVQNDLHAFVLSRYYKFKAESKTSIEILRQLFYEVMPPSRRNNPSFSNAAHAFVLLYFDDCTIFEKTKSEIHNQKNLFSDL